MKTPQDFLKDVSELRTNCKRLLDSVKESRTDENKNDIAALKWDLVEALIFLDEAVEDCGGEPED